MILIVWILTINIIRMNNLQLFSKLKRKNKSILPQSSEKFHKALSQSKRLSPFSRIQRPFQLTTLENSKVLPKNIVYDKQALYLEVLSLKMELNQVVDENIRLKTKIGGLEKQLATGSQKIERTDHSIFKLRRNKSEINKNNENILIQNLKKMIKEVKKESETLKKQNGKMKTIMKVTKVNEFEIESSLIMQENKRLALINEDLQHKLQTIEKKYQNIQKVQQTIMGQNRHLEQENITLKSYIKALQIQRKLQISSPQVKQRRPIQQFAKEKRRNKGQAKPMEELKKQVLLNKQSSFRVSKKEHLKAMRIQYNIFPLKKEPNPIIKQLFKSESQINQTSNIQPNTEEVEVEAKIEEPHEDVQNDEKIEKLPVQPRTTEQSKQVDEIPEQKKASQIKKEQPQKVKNIFQSHQDKEEQIDNQKLQINSSQIQLTASKKKIEKNIQSKIPRAHSEPQQQKIKSKSMYRLNKRIINEVCQLLTYRMIAQRYTFKELKADIQQASAKEFSYVDLCHMLVNEPFYLTVDYCRAVLSFLLEKQRPTHNDNITSLALMSKLRRLIKDFECVSQQEQHKIIENCASIITEHSKEIKTICHYQANQNSTIKHEKLKELLQKLGLEEMQISIIIGQLSICSQDLSHLNLDVLFERFDLNQIASNQQDSKIIEQAENDDSLIVSKGKEELISAKRGTAEQIGIRQSRKKRSKTPLESNES